MAVKAYRFWNQNNPVFWLSGLKGKVGDWEYSNKSDDAILLNDYWQKRFAKDCRVAGVEPLFVEATNG